MKNIEITISKEELKKKLDIRDGVNGDSIRGEKGDKGDAGRDGVDGKSIKGDKGERGSDGKDGKSIRGEKGESGKDGYSPIKNVDYFDGKDGYTPIKGKDYYTKKEREDIIKEAKKVAQSINPTNFSFFQRAISVTKLEDVDLDNVQNEQTLIYRNGKWINYSPIAAGVDKQVQFNDGGILAGDPNFIFDKTINRLEVDTVVASIITPDGTLSTPSLQIGTGTPNGFSKGVGFEIAGTTNEFSLTDSTSVEYLRIKSGLTGNTAVFGGDISAQNLSNTNTGDQVGDGVTITGAGTVADPFVAVAGSGDVVGPASAVDNNIAVFNSTTGKIIKDGGKTIAELNPMTTLGDTMYGGASGVNTRLAGNTTASPKFLTSLGDGTNATAPYWDIIPAASNINYYLSDVASDVSTYYKQTVNPVTAGTFIASGIGVGTTLIGNLITEPNMPGVTFIPAGQFDVELIVALTGGTRELTTYAEIWEANASGVDIAKIGTTTQSPVIASKASYKLDFVTASPYTLASSTSRIVTRVYVVQIAPGSDATLTYYFGGSDNSRMTLPFSVVSANTFVPYAGAVNDVNLGSKQLSVVDEAYDATNWDASLSVPTKNAVRDKVVSMDAAIALNTAKVTNATHTGDVTGSVALTIANKAVTYAKIQDVSATDKVLGRVTAGAGVVEEISTTGSGNVVRATSPTLVTPVIQSWDGWIDANETWTYASVDGPVQTFTVGSDVTTKYSEGMRLRYKQSQSLTSYWSMDTNSNDGVGSNNGTDTAVTYTAGKFGNAATFNGTTSKTVIADATSLKPTGEFTVGAWVKTSSTGTYKGIFHSLSYNPNFAGIEIRINSSNLAEFVIGSNTSTTSYVILPGKTTVTDNTWHYIVGAFRNNYMQLYVDGKLEGATFAVPPAYAATNYVRIGCLNFSGIDSFFMNGQIDDVFLINGYALDEKTIKAKYDAASAQGAGSLTLTKYGLITAKPTYSSPNTTVTLYSGTDYAIANATITSPYYSNGKTPFEFPLNPTKWTVEVSDVTARTVASPVASAWYNFGGISISAPIGVWVGMYSVYAGVDSSTASTMTIYVTLSTGNSTESNIYMTSGTAIGTVAVTYAILSKNMVLPIQSKTTYYLNTKTAVSGMNGLYNANSIAPLVIRLCSAYL